MVHIVMLCSGIDRTSDNQTGYLGRTLGLILQIIKRQKQRLTRISGRTSDENITVIKFKFHFLDGRMIACPSKFVAPHQMISIIQFRLKLK